MADYTSKQRVRIIKGKYADNLYGTFIGYSGTMKAYVKVDKDTVLQRGLFLTSIRPISAKDKKKHGLLATCGPETQAKATTASTGNSTRMFGAKMMEDPMDLTPEDIKSAGAWKSNNNNRYMKETTAIKADMKRMSELMKELEERVSRL